MTLLTFLSRSKMLLCVSVLLFNYYVKRKPLRCDLSVLIRRHGRNIWRKLPVGFTRYVRVLGEQETPMFNLIVCVFDFISSEAWMYSQTVFSFDLWFYTLCCQHLPLNLLNTLRKFCKIEPSTGHEKSLNLIKLFRYPVTLSWHFWLLLNS